MNNLSCFNNHMNSPTRFFTHLCVVPFCAKDTEGLSEKTQLAPNQSHFPNFLPQKIIQKILKAINQNWCLKRKQQEESLPISNKMTKKTNKSMRQGWKKIKEEEDGECLWKKTILMGEKCKPLQFSGAIFYDNEGNQISKPLKLPTFTFSSLRRPFSRKG